MCTPTECVRDFHRAFDLPAHDRPTGVAAELAELRQRLLDEEVAELAEAAATGNLAALAHELADVVYVAYGTALTYGIDLDAVIAEVHRANMSKLGPDGKPLYRADGKVAKGPEYRPPDIAGLLARAVAAEPSP